MVNKADKTNPGLGGSRFSLFASTVPSIQKPITQPLRDDEVESLLKQAVINGLQGGHSYYERAIEQLSQLDIHHPLVQKWVPKLRLATWRSHDLAELHILPDDLSKAIDADTFKLLKDKFEQFLENYPILSLPSIDANK